MAEWWTAEDLHPPIRTIEAEVQVEPGELRKDGSVRPAHVRQLLMLPRGFWRRASMFLVIRTYEDGSQTTGEEWRIR